jgi:hypothetical protein
MLSSSLIILTSKEGWKMINLNEVGVFDPLDFFFFLALT